MAKVKFTYEEVGAFTAVHLEGEEADFACDVVSCFARFMLAAGFQVGSVIEMLREVADDYAGDCKRAEEGKDDGC